MKKTSLIIIIKPLALSLAMLMIFAGYGCTTVNNMSPELRASIHTVSIDPVVTVADNIFYQGMAGDFGGAVGGAVGGVIAASASDPRLMIKEKVRNGGFDLGAMTRNTFMKQLNEAQTFFTVVETNGDAKIKLEVTSYGLGRDIGLSSELKPSLEIFATVYQSDEKYLWRKRCTIMPVGSGATAHSLKEYMKSSDLLRDSYQQLIDKAVINIVTALNKM